MTSSADPGARDRAAAAAQPVAGPDWRTLVSGRPWRLRRFRDFSDDVPTFVQSVRRVAEEMGKGVVVVPDRLDPTRYVWLQFADGEIVLGDPCRCGSLRFERLAATLLRCRECESTFVQRQPPRQARPEERRPEPVEDGGLSLDGFVEVRLARFQKSDASADYIGIATDRDRALTLVVVNVPLVDGAPVPDDASRIGILHRVTFMRPGIGAAADRSKDEWDIVA